jgi:hypothetical protein
MQQRRTFCVKPTKIFYTVVRLFLSILFMIPLLVEAQRPTNRSRSELGVQYGGMYYIGDLNETGHFKNTHLAGGLLYRFNVHSRLTLRANLLYGSISANDADSKFEVNQNRNLHFRSTIWEATGGLEFNYWPFQIGHSRYKGTAYFLIEAGAFNFNPQAEFDGYWYNLQPLGTEGQGTNLTQRSPYIRTQMVMPIGLGCRFTVGDWMTINLEYAIRKTFTDYLDDVGKETFLSYSDVQEASGFVAAELSNRSLNQDRNGRRGNASTKDWYAFAGVMVTFKLGKPKKCFFEPFQ